VLFWVFFFVRLAFSDETGHEQSLMWCSFIIFTWLISLAVAVGAYYDATQRNQTATAVMAIGIVYLMIMSGYVGFVAFVFSGGDLLTFPVIAPAAFAFLTGVFARAARR
jgi:hypothetical protein